MIIVRLGKKKNKVIKRKNRLKGKNIFIENDLTWEERKVQERIIRWTKKERIKGENIKIGFGKE